MRAKLLLPILAAALLCLAACDIEDFGGFDRYRQDFHYTYPLKSGGRLAVETFNGSVEVSGWDQDTVDISGSKYGPTQEAADTLKVAIDNSPDSVSIRVTRPSDRRGNMGARFVIKIPRAAYVDRIFTSNGAIRTPGWQRPGAAAHLQCGDPRASPARQPGRPDQQQLRRADRHRRRRQGP